MRVGQFGDSWKLSPAQTQKCPRMLPRHNTDDYFVLFQIIEMNFNGSLGAGGYKIFLKLNAVLLC